MNAPFGLNNVRPRTAILVGCLSLIGFVLTIVPDPLQILQALSGLAAIGSFVLAYLNHGNDRTDDNSQRVAAHGHGPTRTMQIRDSEIEVNLSKSSERQEPDDNDDLEERD